MSTGIYLKDEEIRRLTGYSLAYCGQVRRRILRKLGKKHLSIWDYSKEFGGTPVEIYAQAFGKVPPEELVLAYNAMTKLEERSHIVDK